MSLPLVPVQRQMQVAHINAFEQELESNQTHTTPLFTVSVYPNDAFFLGRNPDLW
jgi:hypothetical protein